MEFREPKFNYYPLVVEGFGNALKNTQKSDLRVGKPVIFEYIFLKKFITKSLGNFKEIFRKSLGNLS